MTNLVRTLMIAAVAVSMIAVLQIAASAMPTTTGTLSLTANHANTIMASDRDRHDRDRWRGDRDDYRWRGHYDRDRWRDRDWDWDRRHHHDNDDLLLGGAAVLGLYLLTR